MSLSAGGWALLDSVSVSCLKLNDFIDDVFRIFRWLETMSGYSSRCPRLDGNPEDETKKNLIRDSSKILMKFFYLILNKLLRNSEIFQARAAREFLPQPLLPARSRNPYLWLRRLAVNWTGLGSYTSPSHKDPAM